MENIIIPIFVVFKFFLKSPLVWACVAGFLSAFRLKEPQRKAKKYILIGCVCIFTAYLAEIFMNVTLPIWHPEEMGAQEISRLIVRYNRFIEVIWATGLLLIIRAFFVVQKNEENT
jgi:hypothetical protein